MALQGGVQVFPGDALKLLLDETDELENVDAESGCLELPERVSSKLVGRFSP